MTIKRVFSTHESKSISEIFQLLIIKNVDEILKSSYDLNKVNIATSHERKDKNEQ